MNTKALSVVLKELEETSSRNTLGELLAKLLKNLKSEEVDKIIYLLQSRIYPKYVPVEFNLGIKQLLNFLSRYLDISIDKLIKEYQEVGDMGELVYRHIKAEDKGLSLEDLYNNLKEIALIKGKDSVSRKYSIFEKTLSKLDKLSAKYFVRILAGTLRLGLSDKTVIDSLSILLKGDKSLSEEIERAYGSMSDLGLLAKMLATKGEKYLKGVHVTPGIPLASKLVEREKGSKNIWERMPNCIAQPKFDGIRCQIHLFKGKDLLYTLNQEGKEQLNILGDKEISNVRLFSRNQESLTDMFPDIVKEVEKLKVSSVILDSEIIGWDEKLSKFIPFQETIQRKRKYGVSNSVGEIPVRAYVFDILELNGKDLTRVKIQERLKILESVLKENEMLKVAEYIETNSEKDLEQYFQKNINEGLEGIITKAKNTNYDPGTRNFDWIKLKRSSDSSLNDTIDAVVLGYYTGKGSRAEFGLGTILVGLWDKESQTIKTVAKVGTGFSQEDLLKNYKELEQIRIKKCPNILVIDKRLEPDVWVEPSIVVEVEADEITKSESHTSGFSLRFPRIKKWGRDKSIEQTTSIKELRQMFQMRKG